MRKAAKVKHDRPATTRKMVLLTEPDSGNSLGSAAMVAILGVAVGLGVGVADLVAVVAVVGVAVGLGVALVVAVAVVPAAEQVREAGLLGLRQELLIHESPMEQSLSVRQAASQAIAPEGAAA